MANRLHFITASTTIAKAARKELTALYPLYPIEEATTIIVLGGDGTMLKLLHEILENPIYKGKCIFGLNRGSVGFLMNNYNTENLYSRIENAICEKIAPLKMVATTKTGHTKTALAVNEVSLFRQSHQATKICISIDNKIRMEELICDGIMLATPAGSTAYNLSAHGPILPLEAPLLALTPVSPFRPRRWSGALLHNNSKVQFDILEAQKRPVNVSADMVEIKSVTSVVIETAKNLEAKILFDADHSWDERILAEQFSS
ncbi:MAG: NAD kinase [Alphaproteobacteria bacterium]|nr:NAD kinase [Alphaproteobacteria bacterium]